jgi:hypothetical protein
MDKTQPPSLHFGGRLVTPFNASLICHRDANEFDMENGFLKSVERPALGCRPPGKIVLQISLDVMLHSKPGTQVHHPESVILPVNALAVLAEVVGPAPYPP